MDSLHSPPYLLIARVSLLSSFNFLIPSDSLLPPSDLLIPIDSLLSLSDLLIPQTLCYLLLTS